MTSLEARNLLDRNSLVEARDKARIYGNIDAPHMRVLSTSELIFLVMKSINFMDNIGNLYEKNSDFYDTIKRKNGLSQRV
jgi:hypothetical protein